MQLNYMLLWMGCTKPPNIQSLLTEMRLGCMTASQLCALQGAGRLEPKLHCCVDAKSVWDAVRADTIAVPADKHLFLHVLKMREFLNAGLIDKWWWIDTVDMISDGLAKGSLPRGPLLAITGGKTLGAARRPSARVQTRSSDSVSC